MTIENLSLFKAMGSKMDYLNQRQTLISQNVANSDTPDYRPLDLKPVDFGAVLKDLDKGAGSVKSVSIEATNPMHMGGANQKVDLRSEKQKRTYEVAPAGNAVIMEEQLMNAGQNILDYNLVTGLYQKNIGLIRTALGRQ